MSRWIKRDRARMLSHVHPPNNRGYTAYVNVNPCTRGIQAMLYYVRVYPWRMPGWITDGHVCGWNIVVSGNRTRVVVCTPVHIHALCIGSCHE